MTTSIIYYHLANTDNHLFLMPLLLTLRICKVLQLYYCVKMYDNHGYEFKGFWTKWSHNAV